MAAGASVPGAEWQDVFPRLIGISSFVRTFFWQHCWVVWPSFSNRELFLGHWPCTTHKKGEWFLPRSWLQCGWNESCAAFLRTVWEAGDNAAACASVDLALLILLLSQPFCFSTIALSSQTGRAELRSLLQQGFPSLTAREACWGLFRITNTGK